MTTTTKQETNSGSFLSLEGQSPILYKTFKYIHILKYWKLALQNRTFGRECNSGNKNVI